MFFDKVQEFFDKLDYAFDNMPEWLAAISSLTALIVIILFPIVLLIVETKGLIFLVFPAVCVYGFYKYWPRD